MSGPDALDKLIARLESMTRRYGPDLRKVLNAMMKRAGRELGRVRHNPTRAYGRRRPRTRR